MRQYPVTSLIMVAMAAVVPETSVQTPVCDHSQCLTFVTTRCISHARADQIYLTVCMSDKRLKITRKRNKTVMFEMHWMLIMYLHKAQVFLAQNQLILLVNNEYDQQNKGLYVSVTILQCISLIICTQHICVNEEISQFLPGVDYLWLWFISLFKGYLRWDEWWNCWKSSSR